jgi:hypothetical protein
VGKVFLYYWCVFSFAGVDVVDLAWFCADWHIAHQSAVVQKRLGLVDLALFALRF